MKRSYEAPRLAKHEQLGAITAQYISPPFPPPVDEEEPPAPPAP
jgi:hypothetical protein